jgi:hypothetical protein
MCSIDGAIVFLIMVMFLPVSFLIYAIKNVLECGSWDSFNSRVRYLLNAVPKNLCSATKFSIMDGGERIYYLSFDNNFIVTDCFFQTVICINDVCGKIKPENFLSEKHLESFYSYKVWVDGNWEIGGSVRRYIKREINRAFRETKAKERGVDLKKVREDRKRRKRIERDWLKCNNLK